MSSFKTEQEVVAAGWMRRADGTWFKPPKGGTPQPSSCVNTGELSRQGLIAAGGVPEPKPKRVFTSELDRLNKTERRCYDMLRARHHPATTRILIHAYTLRLGNDLRYIPDLAIVHLEGGRVDFIEVKGPHIWDRALHKPKMAANLYQHHTFWIFQWKAGAWTETRLQP